MDPEYAEYRLKRMVAWQTDPCLSEQDVHALLLACRRIDSFGFDFTMSQWTPRFALNWAAAEGWAWKAGACSDRYHWGDGMTNLQRQQVFQHCQSMADMYRLRASDEPQSIRSQGPLIVNRQGLYSLIPWWYELATN